MSIDINLGVLGKEVIYKNTYDASLLFAIERSINRSEINIYDNLPFDGLDVWRCYEISWLGKKGKPEVGILELYIPAASNYLIESKSLKLYLNSFNNSVFESSNNVMQVIKNDLEHKLECNINLDLKLVREFNNKLSFNKLTGKCLDDLDIDFCDYKLNKDLLEVDKNLDRFISEELYTDLFKSNCPITNQPDWASIWISYSGENKINHESLLKYLISFRNNNEFHEHCVERIFVDILSQCEVDKLTVAAYYTRRGGIDINPWRSNDNDFIENVSSSFFRLIRQ
jgi:7-cyano-7-deazaguanine reductase